jgi:homoserine dehydrogenase
MQSSCQRKGGAFHSPKYARKQTVKDIAVALLGLGTVGRAFARYADGRAVAQGTKISIRAVADSSGGTFLQSSEQLLELLNWKDAGQKLRARVPQPLVQSISSFICALPSYRIPILVEALPTRYQDGEPGLGWLCQALSQGTSVVTVDKGPVAHGLDLLLEQARKSGVRLAYSGTTGVTAPREISGCTVSEIRGVLNGTTNFILTEMQERLLGFESALSRAQALGIAEPDPSLDIEGWDTACKILILAKSWMSPHAQLEDVSRLGIGPQTDELIKQARSSGCVVRLVGRARFWQDRLRASVAPKILAPDSPFFSVSGTSKAAVFDTVEKGEVFIPGLSGLDAVSQTILNDVLFVAN